MKEVNASVTLASSTMTNIRMLLMNLRLGKEIKTLDIEVMLSRSLTDIAVLMDYIELLEKSQTETSNG